MTNVRVNPPSVKSYQTGAQSQFDSIHSELNKLVSDVVTVHYFGENAVKFKTDCGNMATEFANGLSTELGAIVGAVNTATSNIAASLGAARMTLNWQSKPLSPPKPSAGDGSVDVDPSALVSLKGTVTAHFGTLKSALDSHLTALRGTDWTGNAKEQVVGEVGKRTTAVKSKADQAEQALNKFIQQQVDDVKAADKV
jgi:hypothetical protein